MEALRNPCTQTVSEERYRGMADSASHAAWGKWTATSTQRHRWARGNEHVVASNNFEEEEEPQLEDKSENDLRMSRATPADGLRDGISRTGLGRRSMR